MSSDDEDYGPINSAVHKKLLSEINEIVKVQHIKKPTRGEAAIKNTEFDLVKTTIVPEDDGNNDQGVSDNKYKHNKKNVSISSVADIVKKNTKQKLISRQLKEAFKNGKVLSKPLEKIFADRIQRTIAYDNTKAKLSRWDAIVTKNQRAEQLEFPLNLDKVNFRKKNQPTEDVRFRYKTQMMKEIEEIQSECFPESKEEDEPAIEMLTLEEMQQKRKELGKIRAKESQKIAKKRMQGKIKSKKYHKLKKREDLKKKLKEFEDLKTTDPEAALKELEKIERQRVQERANLRHKNTGTWAKNKQVRAKYDANVRQDLEAQLALGRELTQKDQMSDSSDSDDDEEAVSAKNGNNPWLDGSDGTKDPLDEAFSGYKKFWEEHNSNQKILDTRPKSTGKKLEKEALTVKKEKPVKLVTKSGWVEEDNQSDDDDANPSKFINDLFDEAEEKIENEVESKLKSLKPRLLEATNDRSKKVNKHKLDKKSKRANVHDADYLGFQKVARIGDNDEALMEGNEIQDEDLDESVAASQSLLSEVKLRIDEKQKFMKGPAVACSDINPDSFLAVKSKHLITAIPRSQEFDDIDDDELNQLTSANKMSLAEAFEDDDIINDFAEDVEMEAKKSAGIEESLMPGWGAWGGQGVKEQKSRFQKTQQEIVKKKDKVIINNAPNEKLQKHLVSVVPFPFTTVKDFEASLKIPIGRDFIPETATRKLTMPAVLTKAGTIIEPMSEEVLVQNGNNKNKFIRKGGKKVKKMKRK